jgi:hypothetical protein
MIISLLLLLRDPHLMLTHHASDVDEGYHDAAALAMAEAGAEDTNH